MKIITTQSKVGVVARILRYQGGYTYLGMRDSKEARYAYLGVGDGSSRHLTSPHPLFRPPTPTAAPNHAYEWL